jgi:biotin carboxyl carrier protein
MKYITTVNGKAYEVEWVDDGEIVVNGERYELDFRMLGSGGLASLLLNQRSFEAAVDEQDGVWHVLLRGEVYEAVVQDERVYRLAQARGKLAADTGEVQIKSPMPGVIVKTPVGVGELVKMGQTVVILESMKMENELKATRDGVLLGVLVKPGQAVEKGEVLVVIGDASQGEA